MAHTFINFEASSLWTRGVGLLLMWKLLLVHIMMVVPYFFMMGA